MGLMDKVKAQAQNVAQQAKSAAGQAQDKMEQMQLRKKADEAAKQLGYLVHKERTSGVTAGAEADKLVTEISDLERQMAEDAEATSSSSAAPGTPAAPETPAAPPSSSDATPGDFKL